MALYPRTWCRSWLPPVLVLVVCYGSDVWNARAQPAGNPPVDFNRDVRPILTDYCFQCHGPDSQARQADLRLDTREGLFADRDGSRAFVAEQPNRSEALRRLTATDPDERMPPADSKRRPTPQQIDLLHKWVRQGALWKQHWSFSPPQRPNVPDVVNRAWPQNEIDHFVMAQLERQGLSPSPPASNQTLIRRVTLDLTGLPPTPEAVAAFLDDDSPDALERVVDRLLGSPHYGERMVWDWLDAARYADSNGYQGDPERTMWPWRDWVIQAINSNMPFDQFTVEQLAGDLLPGATLDQQIATGFNRNHMYNGEGGRIPEETRVENVMDRVETTATVWLGLTMTCSRCHDHKFDPITMKDYYGLFAFFNNTSERGGARSGKIAPVVTFTPDTDEWRVQMLDQQFKRLARASIKQEQSRWPKQTASLPAAVPNEVRKAFQLPVEQRRKTDWQQLRDHFAKTQPIYADNVTRLLKVIEQRGQVESSLPRVMVMDELPQPRETFILTRGTYNKPGERVTASVPASVLPMPADAPRSRLSLARWLVRKDNPLTARVIVNRNWQLFFGAGLVRTPEDFGTQGKPPTHPKLLDWLATELMRTGWDIKRLHKQILTSASYQQSSRVTKELVERDPENRFVARGPRYRLPSWTLRDQALFASGLMVERLGGPPVKPYQPAGVWAEATFGKKKYVADHGQKLYRRSVYTFWRRIVGPTMFFDVANRQTCTVKLTRTNTPLHALATLNDVTFVEAARNLAERVLTAKADAPVKHLNLAFRLVTGRRPRAAEIDVLNNRLEALLVQFAADKGAANELLNVGESARDQSLDPVQHAAHTVVCLLILNLDETLTKQ